MGHLWLPTSKLPREGQREEEGNDYISRLGKLPDCPELCYEDEGDITGIRASAEPGNERRFKCLDAKFTKGIGEREGGGRKGGECGEGALQRRVEEGSGLGGAGWERARLRRRGGAGGGTRSLARGRALAAAATGPAAWKVSAIHLLGLGF